MPIHESGWRPLKGVRDHLSRLTGVLVVLALWRFCPSEGALGNDPTWTYRANRTSTETASRVARRIPPRPPRFRTPDPMAALHATNRDCGKRGREATH
jgi:hypothetical protein